MISKLTSASRWLLKLPLGALLGLMLVLTVGTVGYVMASDLPTRPDGITVVTANEATPLAQIVLTKSTFEADDWTVVQWQGVNEEWHDVDGWQGNFLNNGTVVWWIGEPQLGQKGFRWLVYDDANKSTLLSTSATFDLPAGRSGHVEVIIP